MKRAIVLFPKFRNMDVIQGIREKYDPLANYIAPHITLVFPFESERSTEELREHLVPSLKGLQRFKILLSDVTGDFREGYLFLNVKRGNDDIIDLHDRLYSGVLEPFLLRKATFCPHMTVGRLELPSRFDTALEELGSMKEHFEAVIDAVCVESIDSFERSSTELVLDLE